MKKIELSQFEIYQAIFYWLEGYKVVDQTSKVDMKFVLDEELKAKIEIKGDKEMAQCYCCGKKVKARSRKMPLCDRCKEHCDTDDIRRAENDEFKTGN